MTLEDTSMAKAPQTTGSKALVGNSLNQQVKQVTKPTPPPPAAVKKGS